MDNKLKELYYDTSTGYVSLDKLWKKAKQSIEGIKYKDVKNFLDKQYTYQVNKNTNRPKVYNTILAHKVGNNFQIDIIIYDRYSIDNYKYILCCIDVNSRFAQCRAMTNRENDTILKYLQDIFMVMGVPKNINADNEFNTEKINKFFDKEGVVRHYSEVGEINKNAIIERFNRTIAGMLQKYRVASKNRKWYKVLDQLVESYNNSYHRTIKNTPTDVFQGKAENEQSPIVMIPSVFKVGDVVRIKEEKKVLGKGDYLKYSEDTYLIDEKVGNRYRLKNIRTEEIERKSYKDYELKKVNEIETITQPNVIMEKDVNKQRDTKRIVQKALKELRDFNEGGERTRIIDDKRQRKKKTDELYEFI